MVLIVIMAFLIAMALVIICYSDAIVDYFVDFLIVPSICLGFIFVLLICLISTFIILSAFIAIIYAYLHLFASTILYL